MDREEFIDIRKFLGKTQVQLSRLLCVSPKAVQSFEQGWRKIPVNIERQLLFILFCKGALHELVRPCWDIRKCSAHQKNNCTAWELTAGYFCWFINGTYCEGKVRKNWNEKIKVCRQCEVYNSMLQVIRQRDIGDSQQA
jgi:hypothetical protein